MERFPSNRIKIYINYPPIVGDYCFPVIFVTSFKIRFSVFLFHILQHVLEPLIFRLVIIFPSCNIFFTTFYPFCYLIAAIKFLWWHHFKRVNCKYIALLHWYLSIDFPYTNQSLPSLRRVEYMCVVMTYYRYGLVGCCNWPLSFSTAF